MQELDFLGLVKPAEAGAEFRDEKVLWHWTEDGLKLREALAKCRDPD